LEDIVTPRLSDWFYKPIMFSLQQAAGGLLMNLAIRLSDLIIVPSSRFLFKNIENSNHIVVDGCIDVSADTQMYFENKKINILFAGMLDEEQGVNLYLQTLKLINENKELARRFKFNVCGLSQQEEALKVSLSSFNHLDITYNGFVSSNEYNVILNGANVCLVLQDPTGRYAQKKTPSKGYEYMASGKLIIVTKIGDYSNLPKNTCLFLNNYTPESLVEILINLDKSTIVNFAENAKHYAIENWGFKNVGKKIIKRIL
jgi:glycosyltransferase involved in cell wall biosynthesis